MIKRLYEAVTGTPWTTTVSATTDVGPAIAARYPELLELTDTQLMALTPMQAIAYAQKTRAQRAAAPPAPLAPLAPVFTGYDEVQLLWRRTAGRDCGSCDDGQRWNQGRGSGDFYRAPCDACDGQPTAATVRAAA